MNANVTKDGDDSAAARTATRPSQARLQLAVAEIDFWKRVYVEAIRPATDGDEGWVVMDVGRLAAALADQAVMDLRRRMG